MESQTVRPRITEVDALRNLVREMKQKGIARGQIEANIVKIAVVDLDVLHKVMAAA